MRHQRPDPFLVANGHAFARRDFADAGELEFGKLFFPRVEQRDGAVGAWSDVYGIGACILACMSAKPPQEATSRAREDLVPLALEILERSYSARILSVTKACLELDPRARPQGARELLQRLMAR